MNKLHALLITPRKTRRFETIEISYANKSVRFGFRNLHAVEARS